MCDDENLTTPLGFNGSTDAPRLQNGAEVVFAYAIPNAWNPRTTLYVAHPDGTTTVLYGDNDFGSDTFDYTIPNIGLIHVRVTKTGHQTAMISLDQEVLDLIQSDAEMSARVQSDRQ